MFETNFEVQTNGAGIDFEYQRVSNMFLRRGFSWGVGLCFCILCILVFVQITVVHEQYAGFQLHSHHPKGLGDDEDMNVAIFVQVGNTDGAVWQDLYACIANIALSQRNGNTTGHRYLSLFVSTLDPGHANLLRINVSSLQGFSQIIIQTVKNRGADVGQFLQQIQETTVQNFDAILKIHTKSDRQHRQWMLTHLCGTPAVATKTVDLFKNSKVGLIGPHEMVFLGQATYNWRYCTFTPWCKEDRTFTQMISVVDNWILTPPQEWPAMEWGWRTMFGANLPSPKFWVLIPGTFFWISGTHLGRPGFLKALPKLLNNMTENYVTGSCCKAEHAMERLIPTMVRYYGGEVVEMVARPDFLGTSSVWTFI